MFTFETTVQEIIQRTHDVKSFRFKTKAGADFQPGQFFFVAIKVAGEERSKHFSFSNSPTEAGYLEFTKRITHSPYSLALDRLEIGAWAKLKLPLGSFTFAGEYPKLAFLSGGIGITPIRSICKYVVDKGLPTDIVLLYGNNKEEDIIFKQDFEQITAQNKNLRVVYTLTSADIDKDSWSGRVGYIDAEMIKTEIPDFAQRVFYLCGPPLMVESLKGILKNKLAVLENKIKVENFIGY